MTTRKKATDAWKDRAIELFDELVNAEAKARVYRDIIKRARQHLRARYWDLETAINICDEVKNVDGKQRKGTK